MENEWCKGNERISVFSLGRKWTTGRARRNRFQATGSILKVLHTSREWHYSKHTLVGTGLKPHSPRRPGVLLSDDTPVNNSPGAHTQRWRRWTENRDTTATHKTGPPPTVFHPPEIYLGLLVPVSWVTYLSTTYQRIVQVSRNVVEIFVFYVITAWTHENDRKVRIACEL